MAIIQSIQILEDVVVDAGDATDVEAPFTFQDIERNWLAEAAAKYGKIVLRVLLSTLVGTPEWEIRTVSVSYDGTNYAIIQDLAPIDGSAAGEMPPVELDLAALGANPLKIRLDADATALDGSNNITINAWVIVTVPQGE